MILQKINKGARLQELYNKSREHVDVLTSLQNNNGNNYRFRKSHQESLSEEHPLCD